MRRRSWLQLALATFTLPSPIQAQPLVAFQVYLNKSRQLQTLCHRRTGEVKFLVYQQDNKDLLYTTDYQFLSVFDNVTPALLEGMAELVEQQVQSEATPALQNCLRYCQETNLEAYQTKLDTFRKTRREGSRLLEFYRSQSGDERNRAVDTFMSSLFPLRQPLDLAQVVAGADVVSFGETHEEQGTRDYLQAHFPLLKAQGFSAFACEFVSADDQYFLDSYTSTQRDELVRRILWKKNPRSYVDLIEQAQLAGLRVIGIGEGLLTLPMQGGFVTENRNFQLAHHAMEFLRDEPNQKLIILTGSNHAGFSQNTFEGLRILPRSHPVPDIPTLIKRYLPERRVRTAIFEGNKPSRSNFTTPTGQPLTLRFVENEIAAKGAGKETFMVAFPDIYEDQLLSDWERRYDYYLHLPQIT
jgi:Haem-binding uptake, Tiki superfamily, ChaN